MDGATNWPRERERETARPLKARRKAGRTERPGRTDERHRLNVEEEAQCRKAVSVSLRPSPLLMRTTRRWRGFSKLLPRKSRKVVPARVGPSKKLPPHFGADGRMRGRTDERGGGQGRERERCPPAPPSLGRRRRRAVRLSVAAGRGPNRMTPNKCSAMNVRNARHSLG